MIPELREWPPSVPDRWLPAGPATWKPGRYPVRQCACGRLFWTRAGLWLHRLQAGDRP